EYPTPVLSVVTPLASRCYTAPRRRASLHAISPDDAGEDRALSPLDDERREARRVLQPVRARAGDWALRRALQPPPAARGAAERHAGGRVPGTAGDDLAPPCANQTRDAGAAQAGESERGMRKATGWECDLLTSPNGPEDSDDLHGWAHHALRRRTTRPALRATLRTRSARWRAPPGAAGHSRQVPRSPRRGRGQTLRRGAVPPGSATP